MTAAEIAGCVDIFHVRAKLGINRDAFLGIVHARFFEIETGDRRLPAGGNQEEVSPDLVSLSCHYDLVTFLARRFRPAPHESGSFSLQTSLHHLPYSRLVLWE